MTPMAEINYSLLAAAAASVLTACAASAQAHDANTKAALVTLEKSAYDAWKSKDAKYWDLFLSDRFVGWGSSRLDKASATKEYTGADCDIKSYALSDEEISPLGENAALITHKTAVDGTCGGQKIPAMNWTASVYVRDGDKWQAIFHAQSAVVDPRATAPIPERKQGPAKPTARDSQTDAILAVEREVWEAWREHDAKKIAGLTAEEHFVYQYFWYTPRLQGRCLKELVRCGVRRQERQPDRRGSYDAVADCRHPDI
jgi:hypothetical protein